MEENNKQNFSSPIEHHSLKTDECDWMGQNEVATSSAASPASALSQLGSVSTFQSVNQATARDPSVLQNGYQLILYN